MAGVKNQKWSKFKVKRRTIQRNLIAIRNKLNSQAVYKEDKEDVKKLDEALDFLSKIDYQMCRKTPAFRHGDIRYNKGKHIEKLVCRHN